MIVAYKGQNAIGCGAIKFFDKKTMEIKRMFVPENTRGLGIATQILTNLESWASDLGYSKCILENYFTFISSTSKISVASGGIAPPAPCEP